MTQPSDPTSPTPVDASSPAAPDASSQESSEPRAPEPTASSSPSTEASSASASATEAGATAVASGDTRDGGDTGDGDDAGEGDAGEGDAEAGAETAEGGAPAGEGAPKRKRRRRRKKKSGEAGVAVEGAAEGAGGEGATATSGEGGAPAAAGGQRQRLAKKERPERERPAFNMGDVVFGKVLEVTEDALFIDLSGKAKAIFDLRELLITEEEAEEYNRAHKADRKAAQSEPAEAAAATEGEAAPAAEAAPATEGEAAPATEGEAAPATEAPVTEDEAAPAAEAAPATEAPVTEDEATPSAEPVAVAAAPSEASAEAPATEGAASAAPPAPESSSSVDEKGPQLPRVILEPGAPFVGLVHNDGGRGGLVVLTHHPKRVSKTKPIIAEASRSGALVFGLITGTIKGGVEVDVDGLRAFAPASHVELRPGSDLSHLVGKRLAFAVTQYAKRGRDVVLSRRALLESEAKEKRDEALKNIKFGEVVDGVVKTVVPFGAFIDIGGVEGLVPLSEMSHNRADGPRDVFKVNETVKVKVLRVDEKGKLWLSRRSAVEDPWSQVAQKYAQGTRHTAKVVRLQPFGAFVELEAGIDGLIHSADLSIKRIEHAEEVVKIGDELEVVVASVDSRQHRIALHPAPTGEAAAEEPQRIQLGKMVKVVVVLAETGGLTVRVRGATGRNARGFITASATGTPRGTELRKLFPVGKELEVKIVEMDPRRGEIKLSIKALAEETERNAYQTYRAQVKREAKFGTLADLLQKRNITPTK
jgi:small subunit ribosomal protein S1